ncbi:hypothetical protein D3C87_384290 [compost metagenome]
MKEQNHKTNGIEFRKVYLSDLGAVMRLYQLSQQNTAKLTADFGLPLSVASNGNEIVGYGFAAVNQLGEVTVKSHFKGAEDLSMGCTLEEQAKKTLHSTFENAEEDHAKLKHVIQRLVDWLNNCY